LVGLECLRLSNNKIELKLLVENVRIGEVDLVGEYSGSMVMVANKYHSTMNV